MSLHLTGWQKDNRFFYLFIYLFIWLCWVLVVACRIFICSIQDLVPQPGVKFRSPALGACSLSHWATREVPKPTLYQCTLLMSPGRWVSHTLVRQLIWAMDNLSTEITNITNFHKFIQSTYLGKIISFIIYSFCPCL